MVTPDALLTEDHTKQCDGEVTTVALLIRKDGMSKSLFSRYWRDVHGVLAARIPGFESYVQFHLDEPMQGLSALENISDASSAHFHGIAEVLFREECDRVGLAKSDVTALIQEDETNVFQTSLLYNLAPGASRTYVDRATWKGTESAALPDAAGAFLLFGRRSGLSGEDTADAVHRILIPVLIDHTDLLRLRAHVLLSGDPHWWIPAGVEHTQTSDNIFDVVVQIVCSSQAVLLASLTEAFSTVGTTMTQRVGFVSVYPVRAVYQMVDAGRPTHLGLRGLDVMQTIAEAGADNQRQDAVVTCIYGVSASSSNAQN